MLKVRATKAEPRWNPQTPCGRRKSARWRRIPRGRWPRRLWTTVARRRWPVYFGLGAKLGPSGGVSYVGSTEGVVQIDFVSPRPMHVWGPFRASRARCAIVSLEDPDQFIAEVSGRTRQS